MRTRNVLEKSQSQAERTDFPRIRQKCPESEENRKVYIRGWLGYFGIASIKTTVQKWDEWLKSRFRVYICNQRKVPKARIYNLMKLGIPKYYAHKWGYIKVCWNVAGSPVLKRSITNERLVQSGYYSILA